MPKKLHRQIAKSAKKAGLKPGSKRSDAYIYSTLDKIEKAKKRKRKR